MSIIRTLAGFRLKIRLLFHVYYFRHHQNRELLLEDIHHWQNIKHWNFPEEESFIKLILTYPEFRNIFYYRINYNRFGLLNRLFPQDPTLYIWTPQIGGGLFIQHGFATVVAAKKIGINCHINQQVTVGHTSDVDCPIIGDNVTITSGAKVLGNITVGNNVTIGANAVVIKSVPENCVVVGVPAYIVKRNGKRVNEKL